MASVSHLIVLALIAYRAKQIGLGLVSGSILMAHLSPLFIAFAVCLRGFLIVNDIVRFCGLSLTTAAA